MLTKLPKDPKYEHYIDMFNKFGHSRMSSTYKAVFLRALLDLSSFEIDGGGNLEGSSWVSVVNNDGKQKIRLDLNFIAIRFLRYYWDMEYSFKLKQTTEPTGLSVIKIIQGLHKKSIPTLKDLSGNTYDNTRKIVIAKSIRPEVLDHLKTDMDSLYKKIPYKNIIILDIDIIKFFRKYRVLLQSHINFRLTRFLEGINKNIPMIGSKLDNNFMRKQLPSDKKDLLLEVQDDSCIYCKNADDAMVVDHVIPFNYIYSTELHNCVIACNHCNSKKSDWLPKYAFFKNEVLKRNDKFAIIKDARIGESFSTYARDWYDRQYKYCLVDYHGRSRKFFAPAVMTASK